MAETTERRPVPTLRATAWWWCALVCVACYGAGELIGAAWGASRGYSELLLVLAPSVGTILAFAATSGVLVAVLGRALPAIAAGLAAVLVTLLVTLGVRWVTGALFPDAFDEMLRSPLYYLSLLVALLLAYPLAALSAQLLLPRVPPRG